MTDKRPYISLIDGWVAGLPRAKGETVMLTPSAAMAEPVEPAPAPAPEAPVAAPLQAAAKRRKKDEDAGA